MQFPLASNCPEMHPACPALGVPLVSAGTVGDGAGGIVMGYGCDQSLVQFPAASR
jgi:hypothetical protein